MTLGALAKVAGSGKTCGALRRRAAPGAIVGRASFVWPFCLLRRLLCYAFSVGQRRRTCRSAASAGGPDRQVPVYFETYSIEQLYYLEELSCGRAAH